MSSECFIEFLQVYNWNVFTDVLHGYFPGNRKSYCIGEVRMYDYPTASEATLKL